MREDEHIEATLHLQNSDIVFLEMKFAIFYLVDKKVILVEARKQAFINRMLVKHYLNLWERLISENYSLVDNRKNDFTYDADEIFDEFNSRERLKKIAIVVQQNQPEDLCEREQRLCKKDFAVFADVDKAISWAKENL
jgi:hypothetical protein